MFLADSLKIRFPCKFNLYARVVSLVSIGRLGYIIGYDCRYYRLHTEEIYETLAKATGFRFRIGITS